ncbi:MAG: [protein-PII] uridylyltransferase [Brevundimonas sp.]|uniref:[protein-PII] uridylyltransferase n=1 Tax=Brevundimonas sp. TaxID=1871086 RepID=UPI0025BF9D99|nr:[protein-PII] uridylyltransferase [Brevundimonas sp.]MBX3477540.1 [protein-PII] uridylyltransferase [Brevundimonas sp.]
MKTPPPSGEDLLDARLTDAASASDSRAAVAAVLRDHWDAARSVVAQRLTAGLGGVETARLYAAAADTALQALWRVTTETLFPAPNPTEGERLALLAVGGYGRGVLAPHSDLDLLFLRPWKPTPRIEQVTEFIHYVLWDLGLRIGSASRSQDEALSLTRRDMTARTALLEARFLVGDAALADTLLARFRKGVKAADPRPFITAKLDERDVRHRKAGAFRYSVEPNVKDGKGGLRDLNTLFWIARALAPDSVLGRAALDDLLTPRDVRTFEQAFDFLWRVRIHLHLVAGRAEERLTFDRQPEIARRMGWRGRGDEPAVERFMRRYFQHARDVGALTRAVSAQLEARQQKKALTLSRLLPGRRKKLETPGFIIDQGRLSVTGPEVFDQDPTRLLTLFVAADDRDLDLHPDAFACVRRSLPLVTPRLRRDPVASRAFLDVLAQGQRPYRVLSIMNETGLLGRFLPEWGRIVGQTQFNMYHAYTVDEHTLQAIGLINDVWRGKLTADHPMASDIVHRIDDFEALMLAMLLHDVGKGGDRGQVEDGALAARRACERLGVDSRRIELVAWLVRHHLVLSDYAQKRDVSDPATVRAFAEIVGDPERLRMLLVLTVADIRAVGPGVWNSWKGRLMRDLYSRTQALFRGETVDAPDPAADHPDLVARAGTAGVAAEALRVEADEAVSRVAVAAPDRPGLFADLAAALAAEGADVVGARVATTAQGLALDVFDLQDGAGLPYGQAEPRRLEALVAALDAAARSISPQLRPAPPPVSRRRAAFEVAPVVMVMPEAGEGAAVIEVSGPDRPGLLADLAAALTEAGLSIRSAHVAGFGARAVDSFYVTDAAGGPPGKAGLAAAHEALTAVFDRPMGARTVASARASARDVSHIGPFRPARKRAKAGSSPSAAASPE